jgi:hypothetical protein
VLGVAWKDIDLLRKTLTIKQVIVYDKDNKPVEKSPKSYSGTRTAVLPDMVIDALKAVPEVGYQADNCERITRKVCVKEV